MNMNSGTALYAVFGNPVSHSLSPVMHNAAFAYTGYNGVYLAFKIDDIRAGVSAVKTLNIKGVSVTIPHKTAVMAYLDEIDDLARRIGAVNTIVNRNGSLVGYNSDGLGAVQALKEKTEIRNQTAAILGAGGSARAIAFAIAAEGGKPIIFNRTISKGEQLAAELNAEFYPMSDLKKIPFKILINTTPVGMFPNIHETPIPASDLNNQAVVMDIVYNPLKTQLLKDAHQIGCAGVEGVSMFVYQGAFQFQVWTGLPAPVDVMKQAVLDQLRS